MAVAQGSTIFNAEYFTSLSNRINAAQSCSELQALVSEIWPSLQGVQDAINAQVAALAPIEALLSPPGANLSQLATWISTFITAFLTPYYKPYVTMAAQLAALATQITSLTAAITSAQGKFASCSISIPPIT